MYIYIYIYICLYIGRLRLTDSQIGGRSGKRQTEDTEYHLPSRIWLKAHCCKTKHHSSRVPRARIRTQTLVHGSGARVIELDLAKIHRILGDYGPLRLGNP